MKKNVFISMVLIASLTASSCSVFTVRDNDESEAFAPETTAEESIETDASHEARVSERETEVMLPTVSETELPETVIETEDEELDMPSDEEGEPLSASDEAAFLASLEDTYLMSSGVGGWGAYMVVNPNGTFEYNFHDSDIDMYYICHAQGSLGNVVMIDEFTYKVEITEMTFEYQTGDEWSVTEGDGTVINYTAADSYGIHQGDILTYYVEGIDSEALPEGYIIWYCMPRALQPDSVQGAFGLSGFYNAADDCAYIEDDYE